jgi:glyoxylase I family protein
MNIFKLLTVGVGRRALLGRFVVGGAALGALGTRTAAAAPVGPNTQLDSSGMMFANIGLCVTDLDRSVKFYRDGLGFEAGDPNKLGSALGKLLGAEGNLTICFMRRNGVVLELLHFDPSQPQPKATLNPMNHPGLTHLALRVDDVGRVADLVKKFGGTIHESTRTKLGQPGKGNEIVFATDPDGVRIEIAGPIKAA